MKGKSMCVWLFPHLTYITVLLDSWRKLTTISGTAAHECVSEDALVHLKSYKYSSVDKSLISTYILKHYVRSQILGRGRGRSPPTITG